MTADLEARVSALEKGATYDATQSAIRCREIEFLNQLREIKETMAKESASGGGGGGGGGGGTATKELEEENKKLKATIKKMDYRIKHLVDGMEQLLSEKNND